MSASQNPASATAPAMAARSSPLMTPSSMAARSRRLARTRSANVGPSSSVSARSSARASIYALTPEASAVGGVSDTAIFLSVQSRISTVTGGGVAHHAPKGAPVPSPIPLAAGRPANPRALIPSRSPSARVNPSLPGLNITHAQQSLLQSAADFSGCSEELARGRTNPPPRALPFGSRRRRSYLEAGADSNFGSGTPAARGGHRGPAVRALLKGPAPRRRCCGVALRTILSASEW